MEDQDRQPIDYRNPDQTPPPPADAGKNFGFGALVAIAATIVVVIGLRLSRGSAAGGLLLAWFVGLPCLAKGVSSTGRRTGFAPGVLTTMGVMLLIFVGLCFYAIQNI